MDTGSGSLTGRVGLTIHLSGSLVLPNPAAEARGATVSFSFSYPLVTPSTHPMTFATRRRGTESIFPLNLHSLLLSGLLCLGGLFFLLAPRVQAQTPKETLLTSSNSEVGGRFGHSVAMDGDLAIIGAPGEDGPDGSRNGAAYIFERSGNSWQQIQVLRTSKSRSWFGYSVAIDEDRVIVGAPIETAHTDGNAFTGAAYVFERSRGTWEQRRRLRATDPNRHDFFGRSVAIDSNRAIVGLNENGPSGNKHDAGAVYVFERSSSGWPKNAVQILRASNAEEQDLFRSQSTETALLSELPPKTAHRTVHLVPVQPMSSSTLTTNGQKPKTRLSEVRI